MSSNTTRKPILISGAGLASLLLAQSLLRASIPFQIYERDRDMSFRAQGYRLRLSADGLDAIESVLNPEDWQVFWDACSKTKSNANGLNEIYARTGETIPEEAKDEQPKVEKPKFPAEQLASRGGKVIGISRGEMRSLFMKGCEDFIIWSHKITGYELTDSGVYAVFADGSKSVEGDMLVGGEGIYSKVASQLSNGKLKTYDTGARGIHGQAPITAFKGLGEGVWRMVDEGNTYGKVSVITNVKPGELNDPNEAFGWTMVAQPGVVKAPNDDYSSVGQPAADMAKLLTAEWHPRIKPLFDEMIINEAAFWKITCSTPSGVSEWKNEPRVTLIGDAVHSMTPAGGIGANTAVRDSALLGRLLSEAGGYREDLTAAYEKEMRVYASEAVASSYGLAEKGFGVVIDENSKTV